MKINREIIEEYTDFLASVHDSIISEVHTTSSDLSSKIAYKICTFLEDKKNFEKCSIIVPNENDLKIKIESTIREYFLSSISDIEDFIRKQNSSLDLCINDVAEKISIDVEHFLYNSENNRHLLSDNDMLPIPTNAIIDSIITHINFRNANNEDFRFHENMIENHVKETAPTLLNEKKEDFEEIKRQYKQKLDNGTDHLFTAINGIKNLDSLTEEEKNELVYGKEEESELAKQFK